MPVLWDDKYATGIAVIDFDHRTLFNITNMLSDAIQSGQDADAVGQTIDHLIDYIERHFAREEEMFSATEFPAAARHRAKHREIEKTVRDIANKYRTDPSSLNSAELLMFLEQWLAKHILKSDTEYVPYVRNSTSA